MAAEGRETGLDPEGVQAESNEMTAFVVARCSKHANWVGMIRNHFWKLLLKGLGAITLVTLFASCDPHKWEGEGGTKELFEPHGHGHGHDDDHKGEDHKGDHDDHKGGEKGGHDDHKGADKDGDHKGHAKGEGKK
ncbi:MAG: hypothetical protein ACI8UO_001127 [Verrucomicrobiales bacterium]|jgi:hypothetical protein